MSNNLNIKKKIKYKDKYFKVVIFKRSVTLFYRSKTKISKNYFSYLFVKTKLKVNFSFLFFLSKSYEKHNSIGINFGY